MYVERTRGLVAMPSRLVEFCRSDVGLTGHMVPIPLSSLHIAPGQRNQLQQEDVADDVAATSIKATVVKVADVAAKVVHSADDVAMIVAGTDLVLSSCYAAEAFPPILMPNAFFPVKCRAYGPDTIVEPAYRPGTNVEHMASLRYNGQRNQLQQEDVADDVAATSIKATVVKVADVAAKVVHSTDDVAMIIAGTGCNFH
ncbi:hypothetical protein Dimus_005009 [Dionaea muscipula]